jgi:predicted RNase H-like nuclease (RuvC/YqgF family)
MLQSPATLAITGIDQLREEISELLRSVEQKNRPSQVPASPEPKKPSQIDNNKLHIIGLRSSLKAAQEKIEALTDENERLRRDIMNSKRTIETKQMIAAATDCYKIGNREKTKIIGHLKEEIKMLKADKERMRDELATLSRIIKTVLIKN